MNELRTDMPEIGDEFLRLAEVHSTEPRCTVMLVNMDVEHPKLILQGDLQRLSDRRRSHHRSHARVSDVILIGHCVKTVCEYDPTRRLQRAHCTGEESDPFSSKRMRSLQVVTNSTQQTASDPETYPHLSAVKCCANI